jgi:hypothetical protein
MFPMLGAEEQRALTADIRDNGLHAPIVTFEGKILDGRNRYRACQVAGVKPVYKEYKGVDPLGYVVSLNLKRRHLDESQRGMVAAKIATLPDGVRSDRQAAQICAASQTAAALAITSKSPPSRRSKPSAPRQGCWRGGSPILFCD